MATMEFNVIFDWEGAISNLFDQETKRYFEHELFKAHNAWCEAVNPKFESWNLEADSLGIAPDEDWDSEYSLFMWKKQNCVLTQMVMEGKMPEPDKLMKNMISYMWTLGKEMNIELNIIGVIGKINMGKVSFHLEEA